MDQGKIDALRQEQQRQAERKQELDTIANVGDKIQASIAVSDSKVKKVDVQNDIAKSSDIKEVVSSLNSLSENLRPQELKPLVQAITSFIEAANRLPDKYPEFPKLPDFPKIPDNVKVNNLKDIQPWLAEVVKAVGNLKLDPTINVTTPDVKVPQTKLDLSPLTTGLKNVESAISKISIPESDFTELLLAVRATNDTISNLRFPTPNYVLPFTTNTGKATQVKLDASGNLPVSASLAKDNIPASGLTQAVATMLVDGSGNQITSFGGGTQYAETTTTSPGTGTLALGRYKSTPPSLTDGQMSALQVDSSGALKITGSLSVGGTTDNSAFTAGTSTGTPTMGFYHSTIDTVTDGRAAAVGITSKRALLVNLQTAAGAETGVAAAPLQVSLANTGSNSTAVKVDGSAVTQPVSLTSTTITGTVTVDSELTTADLDTGAGTDTRAVVGLVGSKSGGGVLIPGDATKGLAVDLTATGSNTNALKVDGSATTQPVSGTVAVSNSFALDATVGTTNTEIGATNETAAASDTATSGLNGRLQRIAQRLTSLIALLPGSLGQKAMTGSLAVTVASDQSAIPASQSGTWTVQPGNTANTTAWKVDASSVAVPITDNSGSITVDQPTGTNLHTVLDSGTLTTITNVVHVDDNAGSLTVDYATTGSGNSTGALRVELPTNGTGVVGLNAGSNIIGKVAIDQTTPGTTNAVDTELPATTAPADGATVATAPFVQSANTVFNGTTYDRAKSVVDATNSTGTGIQASGLVGQFDDVSPTVITENQFGNVRITANRGLHTNLRSSNGNELGTSLNPLIIDDLAGDVSTIAGQPVATSAPGVQINTIAGEMGEPIGTTGNRLNVHTRGAQDATEYTVPAVPYFNNALTNTTQIVKTGRTNLYYLNIYNPNSSVAFVQVFDVPLGKIKLGASTPTEVWPVPAGGIYEEVFLVPLSYLYNLQIAATTTATGSTAPTTALSVNLRTTA